MIPRARIQIGSRIIDVPRDLATAAGWVVNADGDARPSHDYDYLRLARALSESKTGEDALLRAIALGEEEGCLAREREAAERVARIEHETAKIEHETARLQSREAH